MSTFLFVDVDESRIEYAAEFSEGQSMTDAADSDREISIAVIKTIVFQKKAAVRS